MDPSSLQIIIGLVSIVGSGFAALGVLKIRGAVMEERVANQGTRITENRQDLDDTQTDVSALAKAMQLHHGDNDRHITTSFMKMCDLQHSTLCGDMEALKKGQRRIEDILLKRRAQIADE